MYYHVLVTGSRTISQSNFVRSVLDRGYGHYEELIHGGAKGADSIAAAWAWNRGVKAREFKAEWSKYGKSAGYKRNAQMLEYLLSQDPPRIVLAFVDKPLAESKGTSMMVRLALQAGVPTHIFDTVQEKELEIPT